jgi:hypothetical protein
MFIIKISSNNLGQIIDGLKQREEAYHITAEYYETGNIDSDQQIVEVSGQDEAINMTKLYRDLIADLEGQMARQTFMETEINQHLANTGGS